MNKYGNEAHIVNMACCHISSLQTMGGVFSGKEQDATRGIYALAGMLTDHSSIVLRDFRSNSTSVSHIGLIGAL